MTTLVESLNSQFSLAQNLDFFVRVLVACLCGGCIGIERSKRFKEAGIRTHIIVCCGAALMMMVSKYAFADLADTAGELLFGTKGADPSRIASQVVNGISFLGAGVIFKHGSSIKGLTTAAGLWATAGIGLAIGAGMYPVALFTTVVMVVLQIVMHKFVVGADSLTSCRMQFTLKDSEGFSEAFDEFIRDHKMRAANMKIIYSADGYVSYDVLVRTPKDLSAGVLEAFLKEHGEVRDVSYTTVG